MTEFVTTRYVWLRPGRLPEPGYVTIPRAPGLAMLRELVEPKLDGARLEHVTVLYQDRRGDMFVDERSALRDLPRNEHATSIYRAATLRDRPETDPESLPAIYGPAVVFDRQVWF